MKPRKRATAQPENLSEPDLRRAMWARFLDSAVQPDGQVPGFGKWWGEADTHQRAAASAHGARVRSEADIEPEAAALKAWMRSYIPPKVVYAPSEQVARLIETTISGLDAPPKRTGPSMDMLEAERHRQLEIAREKGWIQ